MFLKCVLELKDGLVSLKSIEVLFSRQLSSLKRGQSLLSSNSFEDLLELYSISIKSTLSTNNNLGNNDGAFDRVIEMLKRLSQVRVLGQALGDVDKFSSFFDSMVLFL
jgi:hypothetical protein